MRRGLFAAGAGLVLLSALWLGGFGWFMLAQHQPGLPPEPADAIVALTGAPGRVEAALRLLAEGRGARLLISGVGPSAGFPELARRAGVDPALAARTTLGRAAHTTHGNALETADWVRQFGVRRLLVVTSSYHMRRALAELGGVLPDITLVPVAVAADHPGWRRLAGEFNKYLAVISGLWVLAGREEAGREEKESG